MGASGWQTALSDNERSKGYERAGRAGTAREEQEWHHGANLLSVHLLSPCHDYDCSSGGKHEQENHRSAIFVFLPI